MASHADSEGVATSPVYLIFPKLLQFQLQTWKDYLGGTEGNLGGCGIYLKKAAELQFSSTIDRRKLTLPKGSRCTAAAISVPMAEQLCQPHQEKCPTPRVSPYKRQ